ncbi:hypothetical protein [Salinigranum sp. GCM10025319]
MTMNRIDSQTQNRTEETKTRRNGFLHWCTAAALAHVAGTG